jgi:hypothetical protein
MSAPDTSNYWIKDFVPKQEQAVLFFHALAAILCFGRLRNIQTAQN